MNWDEAQLLGDLEAQEARMTEREWFYNPACDWYDGPPVIEIRDGQKYFVRIPHMLYYYGKTNIPKVERKRK